MLHHCHHSFPPEARWELQKCKSSKEESNNESLDSFAHIFTPNLLTTKSNAIQKIK